MGNLWQFKKLMFKKSGKMLNWLNLSLNENMRISLHFESIFQKKLSPPIKWFEMMSILRRYERLTQNWF